MIVGLTLREKQIDEAVRRLTARSFAALKARFIDGLTLDETCVPFDVYPARMAQIEDKAIRVVRAEFSKLCNEARSP